MAALVWCQSILSTGVLFAGVVAAKRNISHRSKGQKVKSTKDERLTRQGYCLRATEAQGGVTQEYKRPIKRVPHQKDAWSGFVLTLKVI